MKVALILLGVIAIFTLRSTYTSIAISSGKSSNCLALLGSTTSVQDGQTFIVGNVKNNCDHNFSNLTVVFKVDRMSGPTETRPEAIVYAYNRDVKPGETRRFKTAFPISKSSTYRFDGIKAY